MATNEVQLLTAQAGIETTRGTAVAATRKVYADITPNIARPLNWLTDKSGTYLNRRKPVYGRTKPALTGLESVTFQDLPWWLLHAVKGGVTPTGDSGTPTPAQTWLFTPSLSTDNLKSSTFEYNETGNGIKSSQVMVNSWTLRGDPDNDQQNEWMLDLELMARDVTTGITYTASLADRDRDAIIARGTKVYIDDAGDTMGSTQLTGHLISWSLTGTNNLNFKAFAEDEQYAAANKVGRGARTFDAQFVFEFDDHAELDNYLSSTPVERIIRLEREGAVIHDAVKQRLRVDLYGYWSAFSRGNRDTNLTATFSLQAGYDTTAATDFEIEVVNELATLP